MALIQLTFLDRYEYPGQATAENRWKYENGDLFESVTPAQYASEESEVVRSWARANLLLHNDQAAYLQLFASLIGLIGFFRQHNIRYYIYMGPAQNNIFEPTDLYQYLKQDPGVLDLETFNMLALTGQQQHPDPAGMATIADYFCELLNSDQRWLIKAAASWLRPWRAKIPAALITASSSKKFQTDRKIFIVIPNRVCVRFDQRDILPGVACSLRLL